MGCSSGKPVVEEIDDSTASESAPATLVEEKPRNFYIDLESVHAQLHGSPPSVRLLNSEWVLARADELLAAQSDEERAQLALPHRQMLETQHPEAFLSADEVGALETCQETGALAAGAVSHAWCGVSHPDPYGAQLMRLAAVLRAAQRGELPRQQDDWCTDAQFIILPYRKLPSKVALFYDWCSLFQSVKSAEGVVLVERTTQERLAFQHALREMQIWYAHQKLFAVLLSQLPPGTSGAAYGARGWPTAEKAWTMVAKPNSVNCWPMILDAGEPSFEAPRQPPMHPDDLAALLATKRFTSPKADRPLVAGLYRVTVSSVLGGADTLRYGLSRWGGAEFAQLARVLPLCSCLRDLRLNNNAGGDAMIQSLLDAARGGALARLEALEVHNNGIGDKGMNALREALLQPQPVLLPKLRTLGVNGNEASDAALIELARSCHERRIECVCEL